LKRLIVRENLNARAKNAEDAARLWAISERLMGVQYNFAHEPQREMQPAWKIGYISFQIFVFFVGEDLCILPLLKVKQCNKLHFYRGAAA
jgi:hypothetical protein